MGIDKPGPPSPSSVTAPIHSLPTLPELGAGGPRQSVKRGRTLCWRWVAEGLALGTLCGVFISDLGIGVLVGLKDYMLVAALIGILLSLTRARVCLRIAAALLMATTVLIGYTSLVNPLIRKLGRVDTLHACPAIIVLSSSTYSDGTLSAHANDRAIHAYELLRLGYAHELVMDEATATYGSQIPGVRRQMKALGLDYEVEDAGPAADTHDEALAVLRLVRRRGWKELILVTHSWHMRRASAVFEKAGIHVLCSPCVESEYDLEKLDTPASRLRAFRDWLHEAIGYAVYRKRGWID